MKTKKYIDRFAGVAPKGYANLADRHRKVLDIFSRYRFRRILDLGCGDGKFSLLLKEKCKAEEVYGIELSDKAAQSANERGVKAYQLDMDTEDFPVGNECFDAVFAGEVIEHLFDPDHCLDEVYRVLKRGGIFVLSTPNLASIYNRVSLLLGFQPVSVVVSLNQSTGHLLTASKGATGDHIRHFTLRSLKELLRLHRFDILEIKGSCAMLPDNMRFQRLSETIDKFFCLFPSLSYRQILVVKK